jgi:hypothetical protein
MGINVFQHARQKKGTGASHNGVSQLAQAAGKTTWRNLRRKDGREENCVIGGIINLMEMNETLESTYSLLGHVGQSMIYEDCLSCPDY